MRDFFLVLDDAASVPAVRERVNAECTRRGITSLALWVRASGELPAGVHGCRPRGWALNVTPPAIVSSVFAAALSA